MTSRPGVRVSRFVGGRKGSGLFHAGHEVVHGAGDDAVLHGGAAGGPSVEDSVITGTMNYFVAGVEEA